MRSTAERAVRFDRGRRSHEHGQSKGAFASGEDPEEIEGENTVVGDVENDSTAKDGVPQEERGRTNK
jgi:hypothetical protein